MKQNGIGQISGIIILLFLAVGGGIGIYATASSADQLSETSLTTTSVNLNGKMVETKIYSNDDYGVAFIPLEDWTITEETPDFSLTKTHLSVTMENEATEDRVVFSVLDPSMRNIVKNSISVEEQTNVLMGDLEAEQLSGGDQKDGSEVIIVLAENDNYLFQITGYTDADTLDNLLSGFNIVE